MWGMDDIGPILGIVAGGGILAFRYLRERRERQQTSERLSVPEPPLDPATAALVASLASGDAQPVVDAFDGLDVAGRELLHRRLLHAQPGSEATPALRRWLDDHGAHLDIAAALAEQELVAGWAIRTRSMASEVSEEQWAGFQQHVQAAGEVALEALASFPDDPQLVLPLLRGHRGVGMPIPDGLFEAARTVDPEHFDLHLEEATGRSERWGGSHAALQRFVHELTVAAPAGSALHALTPFVHLDRYTYIRDFDEDQGAAHAHLADPEVAEWVGHAFERFTAADVPRNRALAANWFAAWFGMAHDPRLGRALDLAGGYEPNAWQRFFGAPYAMYREVERVAAQEGWRSATS